MTNLATALAAAREDLAERSDGQLIRGWRQVVLWALGTGDAGRAARAQLARDVVLHVLPIWLDERPGDRDPERVASMVDGVLDGSVPADEALRAAGMLAAHVDNLIVTSGPEAPFHVGYAAAAAVRAAVYDEPLDPDDEDPARTDEGLDPRSFDTAFLASTAAAGGSPWGGGASPGTGRPRSHGDTTARRAFWDWWLERVSEAL